VLSFIAPPYSINRSINQSNPKFIWARPNYSSFRGCGLVAYSTSQQSSPSPSVTRIYKTRVQTFPIFCTTASQVCFGLPFPFLSSFKSFLTWLIQQELSTTWPSHISQTPFTKHTINICDTQFLQKVLCTGIIAKLNTTYPADHSSVISSQAIWTTGECCPRLKPIKYSTAYICGIHSALIKESTCWLGVARAHKISPCSCS